MLGASSLLAQSDVPPNPFRPAAGTRQIQAPLRSSQPVAQASSNSSVQAPAAKQAPSWRASGSAASSAATATASAGTSAQVAKFNSVGTAPSHSGAGYAMPQAPAPFSAPAAKEIGSQGMAQGSAQGIATSSSAKSTEAVLRWRPSSRLSQAAPTSQAASNGVRQVAYQDNNGLAPPALGPQGLVPPPAIPQGNAQGAGNPAADPFADRAGVKPLLPTFPPTPAADVDAPEPAPEPTQAPPEEAAATPPVLNEEPSEPEQEATIMPPSEVRENPLANPMPDEEESASDAARTSDATQSPKPNMTCEELREILRNDTIDRISLDVSPKFGRGRENAIEAERNRAEFIAKSPSRVWRDQQGRYLGKGRLIDLRRDRVVLDSAGGEVSFLTADLSDADLAYLAESWGTPAVCSMDYEPYVQRSFVGSTFTWKASALCHKPLYFEEVGLERYGHTAGPILQPVISTGHFFLNIAVLPYKAGIHPMTECQYALGYYRPGNCAPWQIPAIPISGRGALMQAGAVVGVAGLLP